jgi:hypothetical protein
MFVFVWRESHCVIKKKLTYSIFYLIMFFPAFLIKKMEKFFKNFVFLFSGSRPFADTPPGGIFAFSAEKTGERR